MIKESNQQCIGRAYDWYYHEEDIATLRKIGNGGWKERGSKEVQESSRAGDQALSYEPYPTEGWYWEGDWKGG